MTWICYCWWHVFFTVDGLDLLQLMTWICCSWWSDLLQLMTWICYSWWPGFVKVNDLDLLQLMTCYISTLCFPQFCRSKSSLVSMFILFGILITDGSMRWYRGPPIKSKTMTAFWRQDVHAHTRTQARGAFFAWRAPIVSWPRIMCSQVRMLNFLGPSRKMP